MKKYILLLTIPILFSFTLHKYYIALTEIVYKEETKSVQMIMNVFIDDLETVINKENNINVHLSDKDDPKDIDTYFKKYLVDHFKISINEQPKKYEYIGKEYDGNIIFFYLEISDIDDIKSINIENTMFLTYFPEQQNIIKVKYKEKKESIFLTQKKDKALLKF